MHTVQKLALAIAPLLLAARALDIPNACKAMCAPIGELDRRCDAHDGPNEQAEETRCICGDTAIVQNIFPLCLDCIHQNLAANHGDDKVEDAREAEAFMSRCGPVGTAHYSPAATSVIQSIHPGGAHRSGTSSVRPFGGVSAACALQFAGAFIAGGLWMFT